LLSGERGLPNASKLGRPFIYSRDSTVLRGSLGLAPTVFARVKHARLLYNFSAIMKRNALLSTLLLMKNMPKNDLTTIPEVFTIFTTAAATGFRFSANLIITCLCCARQRIIYESYT
jgi:hypothetical protein